MLALEEKQYWLLEKKFMVLNKNKNKPLKPEK